MDYNTIKKETATKFIKTEESLKRDFSGLRTGRATTGLLDQVMAEAYGARVPLNQVANVTVSEARMLSVQVWDRGLIKAVEKGIVEAGLGLNPMNDGQTIRIPIPPLSEERRVELIKVASQYTETARVSSRHIRREALDSIKALKEANQISEDDQERFEKEIQVLTDSAIKALDEHLKNKELEIKQV